MDFPTTEGSIFQKWISAEIWADDKLEDALNIDRKTLRKTHPAYAELKRAVHQHLSRVLKQARSDIYQEGSRARKKQRAQRAVTELESFVEEAIAPVSAATARGVGDTWRGAGEDAKLERRLLRRFTVLEVYRIVLEVAREVLSPRDLGRFIRKLSDRLSR